MKHFRTVTLIVMALIWAGSAYSADMPARMSYKAAPLVPPPSYWDGFYIGVSGGGGELRTAWSNIGFGQYTRNSGTGGLIGGTLGYNWQSGLLVLGLEGDYSWSNIKSPVTNCVANCRMELRGFGTARGRVGITMLDSRVLLYGTGGAAFGQFRDIVMPVSTLSYNQTGWVVGAGVEGKFDQHWSAKLEYLYASFDSHLSCPIGPCTFNNFADFAHINLIRAGLNYKF